MSAPSPSTGTRTVASVLSTVPFAPDEVDQIRRAFEPAEFIHTSSDDAETIDRALQQVDVAVLEGDLDERFLAAPRLRWVHCDHSGLNRSARPEVFERGLLVTGSAGRSAPALAQHAFYFALALTFEAEQLIRNQRTRIWRGIDGYFYKPGLWGKRLAIVGFGQTGREMAKLGRAFGMHVTVLRRRAGDHPDFVDVMLSRDNGDTLDQILEAEVVMLATQLTDETYHLFSTEQFQRMRADALIINLARGAVIDEQALLTAVSTGQIAGAGLDVFETEPLPHDSGLWDAPNVLITPHETPRMPDKTQRSIDIIVANVARYRAGEPLLNLITPDDVLTPRG